MEEEVSGGGGGGGAAYVPEWGGEAPRTSEDIHADTLLGILEKGKSSSPSDFLKFLSAILLPAFGQQPLIQPVLDTTKPFIPIYNLDGKTPISGFPIYPKRDSAKYKEIIQKALSYRPAIPVELNKNLMSENATKANSSNAVSFGYADAEKSKFINVNATKESVKIHDDIVQAVYYVFSDPSEIKAKWARDRGAFPIYLIGALPDGGRHLTIVVILQGKVYSCGVVSVGESGTPTHMEEETTNKGITSGMAAWGTAVAAGAGPTSAGFVLGTSGRAGSALAKHAQVTGSGSSPSGQAQIVSPDWMFDIFDTRIFDIGILLPEHLVTLQTYFSKMKEDVRMTFKKKEIGHVFDHFEFPLDARFAMISSPQVVNIFTNYINCTTFVLSVFKNITCSVRGLGHMLVDPSECISLKYIDDSVTSGDKTLKDTVTKQIKFLLRQKVHMAKLFPLEPLKQRIKLWLFRQDPASLEAYIARDLYVSIILYRYLKYYATGIDPKSDELFYLLVKHHNKLVGATIHSQGESVAILNPQVAKIRKLQEEHDESLRRQPAEMGYGGAAGGAAGMSNEGGRRRRYPKRRTIRRRRMPKRRTHRRRRR
jgi:hypothetical protein